MGYDELMDKLQMRLRLDSAAKAERRMLATLSALSEFMSPEAAKKLGSHLPREIAEKLDHGPPEEASWEEFTEIVAEKEGAGVIAEDAGEHAIMVMKVVGEAYGTEDEPEVATGGSAEEDLAEIRAELPEEFEPLFNW
jgi:uncharacterized protein (DUF2267 family)